VKTNPLLQKLVEGRTLVHEDPDFRHKVDLNLGPTDRSAGSLNHSATYGWKDTNRQKKNSNQLLTVTVN
jgi:hypothetical protein